MTAIVELKNASKRVNNGFDEEKVILNDVSLEIHEHDFITILGGLVPRRLNSYQQEFQETIDKIGNGLEKHLDTPIEFLSGGQRQALSLLMATLKRPELLLLDEHTAALDPKTSVALMELTDDFVRRDQLTALMITHQMEDALKYGNRLIVMKEGQIIQDLKQEEKAKMTIADYYSLFE